MSTTIDNRVVEMQFDNKHFESNVKTTLGTLDKLKQSLKFSGAGKGLEDIDSAVKGVNVGALGSAVESVSAKFSALQVVGVTALANITNSAVNAGKRIASALTIDPIKTGFQEYETQINAVQTILANTQSKGTTLTDVNKALDTLNTYADKTIYNFTQMTRNIGTFTAAGIDLDTAVTAIQGIANLAAVSGSNAQQASTAMYQLSQALASGTVKLMDWNSVVNAGMGGQVFQDALKETARVHGIAIDEMIEDEGSFRETLQKGWLSSEILTETLSKFTLATEGLTEAQIEQNREMLRGKGYTDEQIEEIFKLGDTATQAATKVKTLTQLWDTLKEAAQSGWTQSWELMVGDFEEAKELYTTISDSVGAILNASAEARNQVLGEGLSSGWKQFLSEGVADEEGLKESIKSVAKEHGVAIDDLIKKNGSFEKSLKEGWLTSDILKESISDLTEKTKGLSDEELANLGYTREQIDALEDLNKKVKDGSIDLEDYADRMSRLSGRENIIQGFTNIFKQLGQVIKPIGEAFGEVFDPITGDQIYRITENFKKLTEGLKVSGDTADRMKRIFKGLFSILDMGKKAISAVLKPLLQLAGSDGIGSIADQLLEFAAVIGDFFTSLNEGFGTNGITGALGKVASGISSVLKTISGAFGSFNDAMSTIAGFISKVLNNLWDTVSKVFTWLVKNVSGGDIFAGLLGGGLFALGTKLGGLFGTIKEAIDGLFGKGKQDKVKLGRKIRDVLDSLHDSLESFTTGIKVSSIVSIAIAIGILSASMATLSKLDAGDIAKSLGAIAAMLTMLSITIRSITKSLYKFDSKGLIKAAFALILVAAAIRILSGAIEKIGALPFSDVVKGLVGVGGGLAALTIALKYIDGKKVPLRTSIAILALAEACKILADAMVKFGGMQWNEIARGLVGMGGALGELVVAVSILQKFGGFKSLLSSVGILIMVQSLSELAEGLKSFAEMSWDEIGRGLAAMGGALAEVGGITTAVGKLAGFSSIFGSGAILITIQGLDDLANALKKFGEMQWDEIGRGLTTMGGTLTEVAGLSGALGILAGFSGILGSGAILITIQGLTELASAFKQFGGMQWDEIGRGLAGMGGALTEVAGLSGALGILAGFSGIFGAGAIFITVQGLSDLAASFKEFGGMQWNEIGRGLVAMGGALGEVSIISGALGVFTGLAGVFGGAAIWTSVQGLSDLANALKKFGEMQWDEIGRGLAGMGGALAELALGGFLNTFAIFGSGAIANVAEPLGTLADSVKKWSGVTIPENLGIQIGSLATGIQAFTFGGLGASAIATVSSPLGTLADSVRKWTTIIMPEGLNTQLSSLATGIKSFTFGGLGASAIAEVAGPLGTLAGSVAKWKNVSIQDGLSSGLTDLSTGIKSFSWAFMGGWSINAIVGPLGNLATSIGKWNGVTIPSGLDEDLTSLADAVKSFTWAFVGGWSVSSVTGPLGSLADSVKKWIGVTIPDNLGDQMKSLSSGVKSFSGIGDISSSTSALSSIAFSANRLSGVNFQSIADGIRSLTSAFNSLGTIDASVGDVGSSIINKLVTSIRSGASQLTTIGLSLVNALVSGINSGSGSLASILTMVITTAYGQVVAMSVQFQEAGKSCMVSFVNGITSTPTFVVTSFTTTILTALMSIRSYYSSFYSAGGYLAQGFANGISASSFAAVIAARAMALAAKEAAYAALGVASPSKVFRRIGEYVGEGFVLGIRSYESDSYSAGYSMADKVRLGFTKAIGNVQALIENGIETQPTIRPVLDLSAVQNGANELNGLFVDRSLALAGANVGISANRSSELDGMFNRLGSMNDASNKEVVSAITSLREDFADLVTTISSLQVRMDSGTVVGELIGKIDTRLGQMATYKGRRN